MTSYQISASKTRLAAARFIGKVRREILRALAEESRSRGLTQSDIAREIEVHRSVINRELRGYKDISIGRVAELAAAMDRIPRFSMDKLPVEAGANVTQAEITEVEAEPASKATRWAGQKLLNISTDTSARAFKR